MTRLTLARSNSEMEDISGEQISALGQGCEVLVLTRLQNSCAHMGQDCRNECLSLVSQNWKVQNLQWKMSR